METHIMGDTQLLHLQQLMLRAYLLCFVGVLYNRMDEPGHMEFCSSAIAKRNSYFVVCYNTQYSAEHFTESKVISSCSVKSNVFHFFLCANHHPCW